uniref:Uncharacterized protein n=1 Tax=Moniliophthora roreri TaxID=221103 RepID=A0A0W0GD01_MONRR
MFYNVKKAMKKQGNCEARLMMSLFLMKCLCIIITGVGSVDGVK